MAISAFFLALAAVPQKTPDFRAMFGDAEGCFLARELNSGREVIHNPGRVERRFPPCSTFKIPHTVFALSSGVVRADEVFFWDGKPKRMKGWERNFKLSEALKHSAVWVYEDIASKLGRLRSQQYVSKLNYGNRDLTAWPGPYWLMSTLKISAKEQVELLSGLVRETWPFAKPGLRQTKAWLLSESGPGFKLYGKTGSGIEAAPKGKPSRIQNPKPRIQNQLGWYVGWLESGRETWVFAANYRAPNAMGHRLAPKVKQGFVRMGLLPKATE